MASKYWIGKNPNGEVTDAEVVEVKNLAQSLEVGVIDAENGTASPENAAKATKCLKVTINGTDVFIPCYEANVAS
jgi:hypothetical protein